MSLRRPLAKLTPYSFRSVPTLVLPCFFSIFPLLSRWRPSRLRRDLAITLSSIQRSRLILVFNHIDGADRQLRQSYRQAYQYTVDNATMIRQPNMSHLIASAKSFGFH